MGNVNKVASVEDERFIARSLEFKSLVSFAVFLCNIDKVTVEEGDRFIPRSLESEALVIPAVSLSLYQTGDLPTITTEKKGVKKSHHAENIKQENESVYRFSIP